MLRVNTGVIRLASMKKVSFFLTSATKSEADISGSTVADITHRTVFSGVIFEEGVKSIDDDKAKLNPQISCEHLASNRFFSLQIRAVWLLQELIQVQSHLIQ